MGASSECSQCGRTNRADARFCAGCGQTLTLSCADCGRELAADARFCDGCGHPVDNGATTPERTVGPADAVRKTVTVLFGDLVGSTSFGEQVDPELTREAMARYHQLARETIEEHDGTVAKFIGDGVMALFGVPEVGEDDAARAVRTGIHLQANFEVIRRHVADRYGAEVGLRVGINTGEVVIADEDADVVGDALNVAARLEAECPPGSVLVGESTWRLTRSAVSYEALGEFRVKGKRAGVAAFRVAEGAEQPADDRAQLKTPFVGRSAELGDLRAAFDTVVEKRRTRVATIIGAPGVGKTRLSKELAGALGDDAILIRLRCARTGAATYAPIAEFLRLTTGLAEGAGPDDIVASIRSLVGEASDAPRVTELLAGFLGVGPVRSTDDAFYAVRRLAEIHSSIHPLMLVVDDLQWAGKVLLDLLEHLVRWVDGPVLIVALARPELREVRPSLAEIGHPGSLVIALEGLDADATAELATQLLGSKPLPAELVERLPMSTDGNPLFVREFVRMLVDDEILTETATGWTLAVDAADLEVPPTIQSLLATRIERLPDVDRKIAQLAAVVGTEFPVGALASIAGDFDRTEIEESLERLRGREQVEPTGTYWGNEPIFRFHHVLIRDAAYRRILKGVRADLHPRVGTWMEDNTPDHADPADVAIAHHFEQAFHYGLEIGVAEAQVDVGRHAAELLRRAAEAALIRDDFTTAGGLARRAIDCLAPDDAEMPELVILACEALLSAGDVPNGEPLVERLQTISDGSARLAAWATCFRSQLAVLNEPIELVGAERAADDAADRLAVLGDNAGVAKARLVRAAALARLGEVGSCEVELDRALTAARAGGDLRRITSVLTAAPVAALWGPSAVSRAGGRCLDVMRISRVTSDSPTVEATAIRCQAVLEAFRGQFDTARELVESSRSIGTAIGLRHGLLETDLYAGIIELLADDAVAAEPHLRRAYGGLGQMRIGADAGQAAAYLAISLMHQGRLDEAEDLATESDALAGQTPQTAIVARSALAEILSARGATNEAVRLAEEALRVAAPTDLEFDHANALMTLAHVRDTAGDEAGARRAADAAAGRFEEKGATHLSERARKIAGPGPSAEPGPSPQSDEPYAAVPFRSTPATDAANRACVDVTHHVAAAITARDAQAFLCCWSPALQFVDHRTLGWDVGDYEAIEARFRSLNPEGADPTDEVRASLVEVHRVEPPLVCHTGAHTLTTRSGAELTERHIMVTRVDAATGQIDLLEEYPEDGLPEALARFDEVATPGGQAIVPNHATFVGGAVNRRALCGDLEALADLLADSYAAMVEGSGEPGRDALLRDPTSLRVAGFGVQQRRLLAARAEGLALLEITDDFDGHERRRFAVDEIDLHGRLQRTTLFDEHHRHEAVALLDERAAAVAPA